MYIYIYIQCVYIYIMCMNIYIIYTYSMYIYIYISIYLLYIVFNYGMRSHHRLNANGEKPMSACEVQILCNFSQRTRENSQHLCVWKDLPTSCGPRAICGPEVTQNWYRNNGCPSLFKTTLFSSHMLAIFEAQPLPHRDPQGHLFSSPSFCRAPCVCPSNSTLSRASGSAGRSMPGASPCFWTLLYLQYLICKKNLVTHIIDHNSDVILGLSRGNLGKFVCKHKSTSQKLHHVIRHLLHKRSRPPMALSLSR